MANPSDMLDGRNPFEFDTSDPQTQVSAPHTPAPPPPAAGLRTPACPSMPFLTSMPHNCRLTGSLGAEFILYETIHERNRMNRLR